MQVDQVIVPFTGKSFFLDKMGPTLEVLGYFTSTKVMQVMRRLCKRSQQFLAKREQDIL